MRNSRITITKETNGWIVSIVDFSVSISDRWNTSRCFKTEAEATQYADGVRGWLVV
jgi:hypothetical protein